MEIVSVFAKQLVLSDSEGFGRSAEGTKPDIHLLFQAALPDYA